VSRQQQNTLKLSDVSQTLESMKTISDWQTQLRMACYDAIQEEDVRTIVANQVQKAKEGDPNAIKFVMGQLLGGSSPVTINQVQVVTDVENAARLVSAKIRTS